MIRPAANAKNTHAHKELLLWVCRWQQTEMHRNLISAVFVKVWFAPECGVPRIVHEFRRYSVVSKASYSEIRSQVMETIRESIWEPASVRLCKALTQFNWLACAYSILELVCAATRTLGNVRDAFALHPGDRLSPGGELKASHHVDLVDEPRRS